VSRALRQFEREGLVRTERGEIALLDAAKLKRIAEGA
jgi:DNA-binding transcriptional regulator YhcF (GntR family)